MRKLMWFTLGFAAATAICAYLLSGAAVLYIAILCALFCVGLSFAKHPYCSVVAVMLLGFSAGMIYYWGFDSIVLSGAKQYDGKSEWVKIQATDYAFETEYGTGVDGKVTLGRQNYKVRLYLDSYESIQPGDVISGRVRFRFTSEGGLENATYHKGEGIFLLAYGDGKLNLERTDAVPERYFAAWLRRQITDRLDTLFPEDTAFFAKALLLGDDSGISFRDNLAFQRSGIRHVVAVSGLHVSILFSMVYFVTGRRKLLTLLAGLPVLFVFAAVAGFTPSVVRACIMQGLMILSVAVDREYDPATALSFAVLCILVANPLTVTSAAFQLSVGCMIGIFAFSQPIRDFFFHEKRLGNCRGKSLKARLIRWLVSSVSVSVSAMVLTVPLCAWYFGMVSVMGIIANLLVLWVISFVFCGILAACMISLLWMPGGFIVAHIVSWPVRFVLMVSRLLADIPFGVAYTQSPYTVIWLVLAYCLIGIYFLCKDRKPVLLTAGIVGLYFLSLLLTWAEPQTDGFRMTIVDVGQGQCILLQSKDEAYVIDCGGDDPERTADKVLQVLGANGIQSLDGLILTHYDTDHANGAIHLLETIDVETLYLPDTDPDNHIRKKLKNCGMTIRWVDESMTLSCGTGRLFLYPAENGESGNESSMCILFQGEKCDILVTGDRNWEGERLLLQQGTIPDLEILVAGHHGAANSTGLELLQATKPELVLISVGAQNIHGHPDPTLLTKLARIGCTVRRTDLEGTIIIRG